MIALYVLLGAALAGAPLVVALQFVRSEAAKSREVAQARAIAQQTYITELQNRLGAHTWGEFAQLQNEVASHTGQTVAALNSFGESRAEEAYGESPQDIVESLLAGMGADYEGPTVG